MDDADPILPIQPHRRFAGKCLLWYRELNHHRIPARRDTLFKEFLEEHSLELPNHYPETMTYRHDGTGATSLIDYWVLSNTEGAVVDVGDQNPLNISDHVHISLQIQLVSSGYATHTSPVSEVPPSAKQKIRWDKSDATCTRAPFRSPCNLHYFSNLTVTLKWMS